MKTKNLKPNNDGGMHSSVSIVFQREPKSPFWLILKVVLAMCIAGSMLIGYLRDQPDTIQDLFRLLE